MNKKISGIIGMILSILIFVYFESTVYKIFDILGLNITNYSNVVQVIVNIIIKLVMCFLIYIIYKKDFRSRRNRESLIRALLLFVIGLILLVIGTYLFQYVVRYIGDIFDVKVLDNSFYNIFDKRLDVDLIIKVISDYVIVPYLYCSVILLSVDKLTRRNDTFIILTGVLSSVAHALSLTGTLGFVIVNSLSTFFLFAVLAFIYKKNSSIWFIITLYSFYLISNVFIINYIRW